MSIIAGFIDVFVWVGMYTYVGTPHVLTYLKLGSGYLKNSLYFLYEHFFFHLFLPETKNTLILVSHYSNFRT